MRRMRRSVCWAFAAAAVPAIVVGGCGAKPKPAPVVTVTLSQGSTSVRIRAEVAATPDARERGLMGRRSLGSDSGMLFLFPHSVQEGFWMKDTLIPLDVVFVSGGAVVEVDSMTPCRTSTCPVTTPAASYDRALEVPAGSLVVRRIGTGARFTVDGEVPVAS